MGMHPAIRNPTPPHTTLPFHSDEKATYPHLQPHRPTPPLPPFPPTHPTDHRPPPRFSPHSSLTAIILPRPLCTLISEPWIPCHAEKMYARLLSCAGLRCTVCLFCGALPGWRVREGWDPMDGDDGARRWDVGEIGGQVSDGVRNSWMGRDETMGMRLWR